MPSTVTASRASLAPLHEQPSTLGLLEQEEQLYAMTRAADETLNNFINSIALIPTYRAIFKAAIAKVEELARGAFPGDSPSIGVFGSVRSGLATLTSDVNINLKLRGGERARKHARGELRHFAAYIKARHDSAIENVQLALKKARPCLELRIYGTVVRISMNCADDEAVAGWMEAIMDGFPIARKIVHLVVHALAIQRINIPSHVIAGLAAFYLQLQPHIPRDGPMTTDVVRGFFSFICHCNFGTRLIVIDGFDQSLQRNDGTNCPVYLTLRDPTARNIAYLVNPKSWSSFVDFSRELFKGLRDEGDWEATLGGLCVASTEYLVARAAVDMACKAFERLRKRLREEVDNNEWKAIVRPAKRARTEAMVIGNIFHVDEPLQTPASRKSPPWARTSRWIPKGFLSRTQSRSRSRQRLPTSSSPFCYSSESFSFSAPSPLSA